MRQHREDYEDWYLGFVGFCSTFGAKYFGGYGKDKGGKRSISNERIRNVKRQAPKLIGIHFECADFRTIEIPKNSVVYCDPPYCNTVKYKGSGKFPYEEFYDWCRENSKHSKILISEYSMPDDFKVIWEKEQTITLDSNRTKGSLRIERLFTI